MQRSDRCVIVVDSLDEALVTRGTSVADVIAETLSAWPPWIRLIVSARTEDCNAGVLHQLRSRLVVVDIAAPPGGADVKLQDVQEYIKVRVSLLSHEDEGYFCIFPLPPLI